MVLTLDDPTSSANTMNALYQESMGAAIDRLEADGPAATSRASWSPARRRRSSPVATCKSMVQAGPDDAADVFAMAEAVKAPAPPAGDARPAGRRGAQRHRARRRPRARAGLPPPDRGRPPRRQFGLPEVTLGLLPGGGGVDPDRPDARTVQDALMNVLLQGQRMRPAGPRRRASSTSSCRPGRAAAPRGRGWVNGAPRRREAATQPWDRPGYRMPGGTAHRPQARRPCSCRRSRPTCASSSRGPLPGPARDHVRGGRGRQVDCRHRLADREPLVRHPGRRPAPRT